MKSQNIFIGSILLFSLAANAGGIAAEFEQRRQTELRAQFAAAVRQWIAAANQRNSAAGNSPVETYELKTFNSENGRVAYVYSRLQNGRLCRSPYYSEPEAIRNPTSHCE